MWLPSALLTPTLKIKKVLSEKILKFFQKKAFLIFRETKIPKIFFIFQETNFRIFQEMETLKTSFISRHNFPSLKNNLITLKKLLIF